MIVKVKKGTDPFKKYWWVILLACGAVGAWVCMPLMDTQAGSGYAVREQGLQSSEQSLDSVSNPSGAPGGAIDLSMDGSGSYRKKKDGGAMTSGLYQPPPEAAAPGAPVTPGAAPSSASASASFAKALKDVSAKTDPSGWGGAKPQKGFTAPKGNFSGLSGFGGGGGGSSGASSGSGLGAFGSATAKTGMATTRGLGAAGSGAASSKGGSPIMNSLRAAQSAGVAAANQRSGDASASMAGGSFDGSRGGGAITPGGGGQALEGGSSADFDAAPTNLKVNDPNANKYEFKPVPQAVAPMDTSEEDKRRIAMMMVGALVGGLVGGPAGTMITMAMMMSMTQGKSQNSGSSVAAQTKS